MPFLERYGRRFLKGKITRLKIEENLRPKNEIGLSYFIMEKPDF